MSTSVGYIEAKVTAAKDSRIKGKTVYIVESDDDWFETTTELKGRKAITAYRGGSEVSPHTSDMIQLTGDDKINLTNKMAKKAKKSATKVAAKKSETKKSSAPVDGKRVVIVFEQSSYNKASKAAQDAEISFNAYIRGLVEKAVG